MSARERPPEASMSRVRSGLTRQWCAVAALGALATTAAIVAPMSAALSSQSPPAATAAVVSEGAPWDGNPISAGLGPTYGEDWCAPAGGENVPQSDPLALIPYGAI